MSNTTLEIGRPAKTLDIQFEWHDGLWKALFDKHVLFIQQDILRALAAGKFVVYLSCPISSRAGSHATTNVEIANFTAQRLGAVWGSRFWFLNPAQYQLESAHGLGLIRMHAKEIELETGQPVDIDGLMRDAPPLGGDYMRMWTRVLTEDSDKDLGDRFTAFYFMSPSDVRQFFFSSASGADLTSAVESYFARKVHMDSDFASFFSLPLQDSDDLRSNIEEARQSDKVAKRVSDFVKFYTVKASAYFSNGSHDEWNIWQELNARRLLDPELGMGSQIAGFYEEQQVEPAAAETPISPGYAISSSKPALMAHSARSARTGPPARLTPQAAKLAEIAAVRFRPRPRN